MDFISELSSRLNEVKNFVDRLKFQLDRGTLSPNNGNFVPSDWIANCSRLIGATKVIQKQILDKCLTFGSSVNDKQLDSVEPIVEVCGQIWLDLRTELSSIDNSEGQTLREEVEALLGQLINRTFIILQQPPRVLRTNTHFPACVRSLTGNLLTSATPLQAYILNEFQARLSVSTYCPHMLVSGKLIYQEATLCRTPTGQFVAHFQGILLKKIFRTSKKGQISVMDEKFAIAFTTEVKCGQFTFNLQIFSLPVVVIVHSNQETNAWATIVWDNNFGQNIRLPFVVPDKVSRSECGQMLTNVFVESTGCYLCPADLNFLLDKISRFTATCSSTTSDLSWSQFAKEPLPGSNFTFWEWFNSIVKLTHEHLTNFWTYNCRLIYGFISRPESDHQLRYKPNGTFLLRFSESSLGCLSIAYTTTNKLNQQVIVHLEPFSAKDLTIRSLADRLNDLTNLKYLFPDLPKDSAFGAFYQPFKEPAPEGYLKASLVNEIPQLPVDSQSFTDLNCPSEVPDWMEMVLDQLRSEHEINSSSDLMPL